jgi:prepilin signal peptidase PulO-like enzyme (type II secretory pathway)
MIAGIPAADSSLPVWHWLIVAVVAFAIARLFTSLVGRLVGSDPPGSVLAHRGIEIAFVAVATALWWWETIERGELPANLAADETAARGLLVRHVAHLVLFTLLAAATWIDFRHRVIPDCITVPGVLAGLVATTLEPNVLLPVAHELARSYAAPLLQPDVLGGFGPLRAAPPPAWLGGFPAATGLAAALAAFGAWWWGCTAPAEPCGDTDGRSRRPRIDPRIVVLVGGVIGIAAAWYRGGDHWLGLLTSLTGMLVAAALVWLTREGASRALGQEAMGLGDVTLMAMVGAWLGWQACVLTCFLAVFIGLAHGLLQVALRRENELPFGPSLCLAAAIVVVAWRPIWERTAVTFAQPLELALVAVTVVALTAASLFVLRRIRGR